MRKTSPDRKPPELPLATILPAAVPQTQAASSLRFPRATGSRGCRFAAPATPELREPGLARPLVAALRLRSLRPRNITAEIIERPLSGRRCIPGPGQDRAGRGSLGRCFPLEERTAQFADAGQRKLPGPSLLLPEGDRGQRLPLSLKDSYWAAGDRSVPPTTWLPRSCVLQRPGAVTIVTIILIIGGSQRKHHPKFTPNLSRPVYRQSSFAIACHAFTEPSMPQRILIVASRPDPSTFNLSCSPSFFQWTLA
ncbi:PREDICTED: uncharacterized protein LOC102028105 [Chinchilla lanigera]|uniref:uncharacterized protein LOC102028105 n=1 Tax=Chinchilla lanigera TaxID=34839 RepID=UPI00038EE13B|nr:PREDICTED: uncharacterized protein LOC102028105 [Chinchilla lanigera]